MAPNNPFPEVHILGVRIHTMSKGEVLEFVDSAIQSQRRVILTYANAHALNMASQVPWFRDFINASDLTFCDGMGVRWAARLQRKSAPSRITPPDWIRDLCGLCEDRGYSLYLLGAKDGVADEAARILVADYPALKIAGTHHGYFDKSKDGGQNHSVVEQINAARPSILLVGFGMPMQEKWLQDNWQGLHAPVAMPVGAMFDYVAGSVARGPRWMTDNGLEWLCRLAIEPRRLWRRYLLGNPTFVWRVLRERTGL